MSENVENETKSESKAPNPSNSGTVGEILENARLERGLTIDDIDHVTHISPEWLTVIEQGAWAKYPSMVYAKGHLKVYAEFLGLDSEELDRQFQNEWIAKVKPDPNEVAALSNHPGMNLNQTGSGRNYLVWGGVLIALSLIAILGIRYSMEEHRSSTMKNAVVTPPPAPCFPFSPGSTGSHTSGESSFRFGKQLWFTGNADNPGGFAVDGGGDYYRARGKRELGPFPPDTFQSEFPGHPPGRSDPQDGGPQEYLGCYISR